MTNVTINSGSVEWDSSVAGHIEASLTGCELVDDMQIHLHTDKGTYLFNVVQWTFNEQSFSTSDSAITYIQTL